MKKSPAIELVGSVDTHQHYTPSHIASLLTTQKQSLGLGEAFTGRPDTHIYADEKDVIKIRAELALKKENARQWTKDILRREREINVHHPHKTWFIYTESTGKSILAGSICPRLRPLHIELKTTPKSPSDQSRYLTILQQVFKQYFQLAKNTELKLDEGLSNFAINDGGRVYYLDDEYYAWDNFIAFSTMLGVFIRAFSWLDKNFMSQLTKVLVTLVDDIFQDSHCRIIISTQLQSLFMPAGQKQALLSELIKGFSQIPLLAEKANKTRKTRVLSDSRYLAIMADIHANEAALDTVLAFYKQHNIHQGIVLGDIVGYGPDPIVCIEKLQNSPFQIIKGNHDHAVATENTEKGYSNEAKFVINWTIAQLDREHREWLKYLPSYIQHKDWFAVHGAPIDPAFFYGYVYLMTAEDNLDYIQKQNIPLCFHGHSHIQGVYARDQFAFDSHLTEQQVEQIKYKNMLVCPGSVGQPRNGDPHAQCAIYDQVDKVINFFSLPYPVDSVIQRMKKYDFSEQLCHRLVIGK